MRHTNWRIFAGLPTKTKYIIVEDLEDAYWQILIAGYTPVEGQLTDMDVIKAHCLAWSRHQIKHAYLRRLPSPLSEYVLAITMIMTILWTMARLLDCLRGVHRRLLNLRTSWKRPRRGVW